MWKWEGRDGGGRKERGEFAACMRNARGKTMLPTDFYTARGKKERGRSLAKFQEKGRKSFSRKCEKDVERRRPLSSRWGD